MSVWIATLADGSEVSMAAPSAFVETGPEDADGFAPIAAVVEIRRKGEPSRAQLLAALAAADNALWIAEPAIDKCETYRNAVALVRAALGKVSK